MNHASSKFPLEAKGQRLDQFLAAQLDGVSRSRVQLLMDQGDVLVNGEREKASLKLRGGERNPDHRRAASGAAEGRGGRHSAATWSLRTTIWPWSTSRPG